jgi:hypothetical protein
LVGTDPADIIRQRIAESRRAIQVSSGSAEKKAMDSLTLTLASRLIAPGGFTFLAAANHTAAVLILIVLAIGVVVVTRKDFWSLFWAPTEASQSPAVSPLSRERLLVAYSIIGVIVIGSFLDMARDTEHWPWSNYPMYSQPENDPKFNDLRLYGVPKSDPTTEFSLFTDSRYLQPFDQSRLAMILETLSGQKLHEGLQDCFNRYESLRRRGAHDGPPLQALRVYRCYWTLDPTGATIEHPDRKVLIDEVDASTDGNP